MEKTIKNTATRRILVAALVLSASTARAGSGPFGFEMGMTPAQVEAAAGVRVVKKAGTSLRLSAVPKPHPSFKAYSARFSKKSGLCKVTAFTGPIESNRSGTQIREAFSDLETALIKRYGAPETQHDFTIAGALWKDSDEFMMALKEEERILSTFWVKEKGLIDGGNLANIMVKATGLSSSAGIVVLSYEFTNIGDCAAEAEAEENSAL